MIRINGVILSGEVLVPIMKLTYGGRRLKVGHNQKSIFYFSLALP